MSLDDDSEVGSDVVLTPWDRRVVAAMDVASGARTGVLVLRVTAVAVALFAVIGNAFSYFADQRAQGVTYTITITRQLFGSFLASIANPLAFAGVVFALSYVVQISAARLDIEIVLNDEDEAASGMDE